MKYNILNKKNKNTNMNNLINNTVESTLREIGLTFEHKGESFYFNLDDDYVNLPFLIVADEEKEILTVIGYFPIKVAKEKLDKMYMLINELNNMSLIGLFSIDSKDGELTFRLSNNVDGGAINTNIVKTCFLQALYRLRNCFNDIITTMYGEQQTTYSLENLIMEENYNEKKSIS